MVKPGGGAQYTTLPLSSKKLTSGQVHSAKTTAVEDLNLGEKHIQKLNQMCRKILLSQI